MEPPFSPREKGWAWRVPSPSGRGDTGEGRRAGRDGASGAFRRRAILPSGLLRRSRRGRRRRGRLIGTPSAPSLMATGALLAAMGPAPLPPALPLGSSSLSAAGVGRRGVGNGWSGFLRLGHERLKHSRNRESECRPQPKQGKHFSARNVFTHIDLPVSRLHLPRSPIKAISCEHRLNIPLPSPKPRLPWQRSSKA
jgi:hypothetical protein